MSEPVYRINLLDTYRVRVPGGDDPQVSAAVANSAVGDAIVLVDQLETFANRHCDAAPASATYVAKLARAIEDVTHDWINQWPS